MFLVTRCQSLFLAESSRWPEQNSGMHAWRMLYWRTVRTIEWSWSSVEFARCHVAWCDDSDTPASMWSGPCTSVPSTCTWFDVKPAASAAGVVVAPCEIALAPGERSMLHSSEHAVRRDASTTLRRSPLLRFIVDLLYSKSKFTTNNSNGVPDYKIWKWLKPYFHYGYALRCVASDSQQ